MLTEILQYLKNWFCRTKYYGTFTIKNGNIDGFDNGVEFIDNYLKNGQYFRIIGSALNDGVWKYPATELQDETFEGAVWGLGIPRDFIALADEISAWQEENGKLAASPFQSESFHNYSYTKARGNTENGDSSWKTAFASRLNAWRKI